MPARCLAEGLGTGLLVATVVGSGIAAVDLSPGEVGLQLLENSTATALALVALILTFGSVSGAHFNPVVTLAEACRRKTERGAVVPYLAAQIAGGCLGAMVANLMFELPAVDWSTNDRVTAAHLLAEVVATFGLLTVIFGVVRSGRMAAVPIAVAGYIGAAYWFTSSTSFANPPSRSPEPCRTPSPASPRRPCSPSSAPSSSAARWPWRRRWSCSPNPNPRSRRPSMPDDDGLPTVLFLCVHNAGRSQMALGWFRHLADGRAVAWSGGSEPADQVNPSAIEVMAEVGIDITREHPKRWTDEIVQAADVVITMGCGDACPIFPGKRYEDWELDDPAGRSVDEVRPVRDDIERRVRTLLSQLEVPVSG